MKRLIQTNHGRMLADQLAVCGAIQFAPMRHRLQAIQSDAFFSPIFFNLHTPENPKPGPITEFLCKSIGFAFWQIVVVDRIKMSGVCGIPIAGEPFAVGMEHLSTHGTVLLWLSKKSLNGQRDVSDLRFMGNLQPGAQVVLVDDVMIQADTKIKAIEILRAYGFHVQDLFVVVDREQRGTQRIREYGINVHTLFTVRELIDHYHACGFINGEIHDQVLSNLVQ